MIYIQGPYQQALEFAAHNLGIHRDQWTHLARAEILYGTGHGQIVFRLPRMGRFDATEKEIHLACIARDAQVFPVNPELMR